MRFPRTPAYRAAINQMADAIADIPIAELAPFSVGWEVSSDLEEALGQRHPRFDDALSDASMADSEQMRIERRKAGARKAAVTRAKRTAKSAADIDA